MFHQFIRHNVDLFCYLQEWCFYFCQVTELCLIIGFAYLVELLAFLGVPKVETTVSCEGEEFGAMSDSE